MRTILAITALCTALAGCQTVTQVSTAVTATNSTLANLAGNEIPTACAIVAVAEGYFDQLSAKISVANRAKYATAKKVVSDICANPPTNIIGALSTLGAEWLVIQNATVAK